jgi:hypothetical protein
MKRIMYVENKSEGLDGPGRIGWVGFSKSGRSFYYKGRRLQKTKSGYKHNCFDAETGESFWVSGPKEDGSDKLYGGVVEIDDDAREDYWTTIRDLPQNKELSEYRS